MALRSGAPARVIVAAMVLSSTVACSMLDQVKANMRFKEANVAYQRQDYSTAIELYEETLQNNPDFTAVYFYLGNSYDNLYKPGFNDPENDALIAKAVEYYELAAERLSGETPEEQGLKMLSLQYLSAAYGTDKLNDPARAEPIIQDMIRLNPADIVNYFALARLYEDAGVYPEAEQILIYAKDARPNDPVVYTTLASFYNRQGEFDKTIASLEDRATLEPDNPEAHFTIATYFWDNAQRNVQLRDPEKLENVELGLVAVERALGIRPDYVEALIYKGLLLRTQANLEGSVDRQQALIREAVELQERAEEIKQQSLGEAAAVGN